MLYCKTIKDFSDNLPNVGFLLGVDYGQKKVGLSLSDSKQIFAMPHSVIKLKTIKEISAEIARLVRDKPLCGIVFGYPLEISGETGQSCKNVEKFVEDLDLSKLDTPYYYQDERFTTKSASKFLEANIPSKKRRDLVDDDSMAAAYILQTALDLLQRCER